MSALLFTAGTVLVLGATFRVAAAYGAAATAIDEARAAGDHLGVIR